MHFKNRYRLRKPQWFPLLFIIVATGVSFSLGAWQIQRLQWKEELLAQIQASRALPPLTALPSDSAALEAIKYRKVTLQGAFQTVSALHLMGSYKGTSGYYLLQPFTLDDGTVIVADIGFVPQRTERQVTLPLGKYTITGVLREPRAKRYFAPSNQPEKNIWFYEDIPALEKAFDAPLKPLIVAVTQKLPGQEGPYPAPHDEQLLLRNDHLGYAITWFSLAIIGIAMFLAYHLERKETSDV